MSQDATLLSILILTEDSARDGHETIAALAKKMLGQVVSGCRTHQIEFEPQNAVAKRAMHGNLWKSRNPRDRQKLVDLRQTIATKLVEGKLVEGKEVPGFVFFHVDGDRPWAEHELCENKARFEAFVGTLSEHRRGPPPLRGRLRSPPMGLPAACVVTMRSPGSTGRPMFSNASGISVSATCSECGRAEA